MFRAAPRLIARPSVLRAVPRSFATPTRRCISTAPPTQKSRSWKSLVARLGLATAVIYYYNTTDVFAEEPRHLVQPLPETEVDSEHLPTIESLSAERQQRKAVQAHLDAQRDTANAQQNAKPTSSGGAEGGIEGLEQEADQQGAFNPETGEINWDCPCLGGMAHGPCGEDFKAAFSCFVFSEQEPKGMDCIDKFKNMQNCFRQYPEVYGSELDSDADDEDDMSAADPSLQPAADSISPSKTPSSLSASDVSSDAQTAPSSSQSNGQLSGERSSQSHPPEQVEDKGRDLDLVPENYRLDPKTNAKPDGNSDTERANQAAQQAKTLQAVSESEKLVPKEAFNDRDSNTQLLGRK